MSECQDFIKNCPCGNGLAPHCSCRHFATHWSHHEKTNSPGEEAGGEVQRFWQACRAAAGIELAIRTNGSDRRIATVHAPRQIEVAGQKLTVLEEIQAERNAA